MDFTKKEKAIALYFQRGEEEVCGVKVQPPDVPASDGRELMAMNRMLVAWAFPLYLDWGFTGLMLPCVYIREKQGGNVESGIALFPVPDPEGQEAKGTDEWRLDDQLGRGASAMVTAMLEALSAWGKEVGVPLYQMIGVDVRPRLALEKIIFDTMVIGSEVFSLKRSVREEDPLWELLVERGINQAWHLPTVPAAQPG